MPCEQKGSRLAPRKSPSRRRALAETSFRKRQLTLPERRAAAATRVSHRVSDTKLDVICSHIISVFQNYSPRWNSLHLRDVKAHFAKTTRS